MDSWPELPPVRDLPADHRAWAWWLRNALYAAQKSDVPAVGYETFCDEQSVHERRRVPPRLDRQLTNIVAVPQRRDAARMLSDR